MLIFDFARTNPILTAKALSANLLVVLARLRALFSVFFKKRRKSSLPGTAFSEGSGV
jgi:hypothetical protein